MASRGTIIEMSPQESKARVEKATKALRKAQQEVDSRRHELVEAMRTAHWDDDVPIAEVAKVVGVSRSYAHRVVTADRARMPARGSQKAPGAERGVAAVG